LTDATKPQPFDDSARSYDDDFTGTVTGRAQRRRVWQVLERVLPANGDFLDLGCGTGEDALWLARRGAGRVVGCDVSTQMLRTARAKVDAAGVGDRVRLQHMDLGRIQRESNPGGGLFAGAVSDVGALNCLQNRRPVAEAVSSWLAPGATFVAVLMGRWCAWEVGWHLLRLQPGAAFRRWRQGREAPLDGGGSIPVWYPTPRQLQREFNPVLELVETIGIGVFLPPPYLDSVLGTRPRLLAALDRLEGGLGHRRPWLWMADHVLFVFRNAAKR